ncbi:MAG: hypothetical protein J0H54_02015, partial [Rhizobiales bacterium]|nr:hypothetical protein [Hyphomicrobiales bacterium]
VIASATGGAATAAGMSAAQANGVDGYFVDLMLRPATSGGTETATADQRAEVTRILAQGLASGAVPDADRTYLSGLVAARTGLAPAEAAARVDQVLQAVDTARAEAKQAAETARKVGLTTTLLTVVALLVGAFIASVAAAFAGSLRDEDVPAIKG